MRTLFILCTAVTVLQVFDVSIIGISAQTKVQNGVVDPTAPTGTPTRTTNRALNKGPQPDPDNKDPGTTPDDDSEETDPPKTIKDSGKRVVQTMKKVASKRTVGVLNGFNGLLKSAGNFDFFGKFIRTQSNNVKAVAKDSLQLVSDFGGSTSNGARHVLKSARVIGKEGGKVLFSTLQKGTTLGKKLTKLGGTAIGTPISIGGDLAGTANRIAKTPSKLSKIATNNAINPVLNILGPDSDQESEEAEEGEEAEGGGEAEGKEEEKKEDPKNASAKPAASIKTPKKQIQKSSKTIK